MLSNAGDEIKAMDDFLKRGAPLDYWWIDAGWYVAKRTWENTVNQTKGSNHSFVHEKIVMIPLIQEDRLALVSTAHDVMNHSRTFDAHLARHKRILHLLHPPRKP